MATAEQLALALRCAEQAQAEHGHKGPAVWAVEAALAAIIETTELAAAFSENWEGSASVERADDPCGAAGCVIGESLRNFSHLKEPSHGE